MSTEAAQILDLGTSSNASSNAQTPPTQTGGGSTDANSAPQSQPPDDKLASKLEILLKREQQAMERERSAKEQETGLASKLAKIAEFESVKSGNYKKALELLDTDYDQLTQSMLKDGQVTAEDLVRKLDLKFEQFKTEQQKAEEERQLQENKRAQENEQKVIHDFKGQIRQYVTDNKVRYELTAFEEQEELVFEVIDEHYKRTIDASTGAGKIMSIQEAADKVELFLEQKEQKRRELNKVKTLWGAIPKPVQKKLENQVEQQKPKTLTNTLTASPAPQRRVPISDEERVQRAIAYAKGLRPDLR